MAASGIPRTSLRNGFYAHSLIWLAGPWRETGRIALPADGPVSWTAREDEAEAAAVLLAGESSHDGPLTLTASSSPTFEDIAGIASDLTGQRFEFLTLDQDEWLAERAAAGQPLTHTP